MLKKLFTLCIIALTINLNAQVIRSAKPKNTEPQINNTTENNNPYYKPEKPFEFKKRSMLSINIFQFVFTNISISYEIFSKDGKSGFQIPFTFGIGGKPDQNAYPGNNNGLFIASQNRVFETGLHYHYYFVGQKKASPFMGVGLNVGAFNYYNPTQILVNNNGNQYYQQVPGNPQVGANYSGAMFAGILFNPNETITFGFKTGLGFMRRSTDILNYQEWTHLYGLLEMNLGFKF